MQINIIIRNNIGVIGAQIIALLAKKYTQEVRSR